MRGLKETPVNRTSIARLDDLWQGLLEEVLRQEFHGTAAVELVIADGTIQRIARTVQRVEKQPRNGWTPL